jgi:hypothetical protein
MTEEATLPLPLDDQRGGRAVAARLSVSPSYAWKVRARLKMRGDATPGPQHNHVRPRLEPFYDLLRARLAEQTDAKIAELSRLDGARARGGGEPSCNVGDAASAVPDAERGSFMRPSRVGQTLPRRVVRGASCNQNSMLRD